MEINKPGGFLIAIMGRMLEKDDRGKVKLEDIENKINKSSDISSLKNINFKRDNGNFF